MIADRNVSAMCYKNISKEQREKKVYERPQARLTIIVDTAMFTVRHESYITKDAIL